MKKNDKLYIPISTEDKELLKKRSNQTGMTLTSYCLYVLLNTIPKTEFIPK